MICLSRVVLPGIVLGLLLGLGRASAQPDKPAAEKPETKDKGAKTTEKETPESVKAKLENDFAALMSNSVLVGRFTTDGQEGSPEDRYEIGKASKLKDELWMFQGIKYGKNDIKIPLIIRVVWADQTPMMSMDELTIPGLGTFSFRLIFHKNRYAGSWQHDKQGGHMWGRVERQKKEGDKPKNGDKPEQKEGDEKNKAALEQKLKEKITVNFEGAPLQQCFELLGDQLKVTFKLDGDALKMAGVTRNMMQTVKLDGVPLADVLDQILSPLKLCIVVDGKENVILVTSPQAAKEKGWTVHPLKPAKKN